MSGINEVPPAPNAASFGEELRKEREMRGISLKEIADSTKISRRFLEAIERNDMRTLPAPVFTRGFVREYARYLGLNADEMVTRYGDFIQAIEAAEAEAAASTPPRTAPLPDFRRNSTYRPEPPPSSAGRYLAVAIVIIVLLAAALGALLWRRPWRGGDKPSTSTAKVAPATAVSPPATTTVAPVTSGLTMELHFRERTWLTAQTDGKTVINGEIEAGEQRTLHATDSIVFKTLGNAGGVDLTLNGTKIDALGDSGDVRHDVRFDLQSVEELRNRT
jgi:cytoskeletal protein RodZ